MGASLSNKSARFVALTSSSFLFSGKTRTSGTTGFISVTCLAFPLKFRSLECKYLIDWAWLSYN